MKKRCIDCYAERALSSFYHRKHPNGRISHYPRCKQCHLNKFSKNRGKPNLGRFKKRLIPWNRKEVDGKQSKKYRKKLSKAHLGQVPWNKGKKLYHIGDVAWQ